MTYVLEKDEFDDQPLPGEADLQMLRSGAPFTSDIDSALVSRNDERWAQALLASEKAERARLDAQAEQIAELVAVRVFARLREELIPALMASLRQTERRGIEPTGVDVDTEPTGVDVDTEPTDVDTEPTGVDTEPTGVDIAQAQSHPAFKAELKAQIPSLLRFASQMTRSSGDAEDLVVHTLNAAVRARDKFEDGTNLATWLKRALRNAFIHRNRSRRSLESNALSELEETLLSEAGLGSKSSESSQDPRGFGLGIPLGELSYEEMISIIAARAAL